MLLWARRLRRRRRFSCTASSPRDGASSPGRCFVLGLRLGTTAGREGKEEGECGASTLVLVADDGSEGEVSPEQVRSCSKCIVSFRSKGGFSTILPGLRRMHRSKAWLRCKSSRTIYWKRADYALHWFG